MSNIFFQEGEFIFKFLGSEMPQTISAKGDVSVNSEHSQSTKTFIQKCFLEWFKRLLIALEIYAYANKITRTNSPIDSRYKNSFLKNFSEMF